MKIIKVHNFIKTNVLFLFESRASIKDAFKRLDHKSTMVTTDTVKNTIPLNVTKKDLISCAISSGGFSHTTLTPKGENFYSSLIEMTLDDDSKNFIIREDYNNSEQSTKTSLSFF